jgi:hypothetical protein
VLLAGLGVLAADHKPVLTSVATLIYLGVSSGQGLLAKASAERPRQPPKPGGGQSAAT